MDSTGSIVQSESSRLLGKALSSARESLAGELAIGSTVAAVLLLEDDPEVAERIAGCLNQVGYRTLAVADVDAAASLAQRRSVAVVLLNWRLLTRLGGSTVVAELRRRSPHGHLPMIVISADKRELMEANRLGIDDYVPNPFHADDLLHVVDEYCR